MCMCWHVNVNGSILASKCWCECVGVWVCCCECWSVFVGVYGHVSVGVGSGC